MGQLSGAWDAGHIVVLWLLLLLVWSLTVGIGYSCVWLSRSYEAGRVSAFVVLSGVSPVLAKLVVSQRFSCQGCSIQLW